MISKQVNIVAINGKEFVGFMSFIHNQEGSNYISTIIVNPKYRRQGVTTEFYNIIENKLPQNLRCDSVSTRTWGTNDNHLNLLKKIGYSCFKTIKDDRGEGIDTVY